MLAMKLREGDMICDMNVLSGSGSSGAGEEYVVAISSGGYGKRMATSEFRTQGRGGMGVFALKFKAKAEGTDRMICLRTVKDDKDEILVVTSQGIIVRQQASKIPSYGRHATGVLIQKLDAGDRISSVSIVPQFEESDAIE